MANRHFSAMGATIFETMSRMAQAHGAFNLGQGFPEGLEPKDIIEAARAALLTGPHQYPSMLGVPALREAVAQNQKRFWGHDVDWEKEVLVTSGATEALADCFYGLFNPGDEVLIFEPAYDCYAPILTSAGAIPVPIRLTPPDWALPFDQIERAITKNTRGFVLNNPTNPIGKVYLYEELRGLADLMLKHDLIAICDEVYEHLVFDDVRHQSLFGFADVRDRVARVGSAGKSFSLTGWKIGYVTACEKLLQPIIRAHQFITFTTPPALQSAVAYGLNLPDAYFADLRASMSARRDRLTKGLRAAGFMLTPAPATYFAIAPTDGLDPDGDDFAFCQRLIREAGVAAVPISFFYGARDVKNYIRFCFAKETDVLDGAVARLAEWRAR
jgi:aspartate/methionine/tyrosine aminotransferase